MGRKKTKTTPEENKEKKFSCHQCRHQHPESKVIPCSLENCVLKYGVGCLANNYDGEIVPEDSISTWECPRCRKICNCSDCKRFIPYQEIIAKQAKELMCYKEMILEQEKTSKALEDAFRKTEEENKILRQRTEMYHDQYEKEMDFLEKFSQDQLKVFQDFMEEHKNKREKLKQGEFKTVHAVPQRNEKVEKDVKPQSQEIKEVEEERARLMKLHEEEMAEMKSKYSKEEMEAKEKFNSKLDQLTKRMQSLKG